MHGRFIATVRESCWKAGDPLKQCFLVEPGVSTSLTGHSLTSHFVPVRNSHRNSAIK